jgi:hypothetical protein
MPKHRKVLLPDIIPSLAEIQPKGLGSRTFSPPNRNGSRNTSLVPRRKIDQSELDQLVGGLNLMFLL